jgi:putative hydrolase of the HAD superfamily
LQVISDIGGQPVSEFWVKYVLRKSWHPQGFANQGEFSIYQTLFFDLDDTLYASTTGVWQMIRSRMGQYMAERLGLPPDEIPALRRRYFETYGTTLRGLQRHHEVDAEDYLAYVHDLPLERYLQPDPALRSLLLSLPQPRWIFTNADSDHARRVLAVLGLQDCFSGVIDVRAVEFACKPEELAFQRALVCSGSPDPSRCVMFDDSRANLAGARRAGFTTVLVGAQDADPSNPTGDVDLVIPDLLVLPERMPQLWSGSPARSAGRMKP